MRPTYESEDISAILNSIDLNTLRGSCVYITGSTGLIGQLLVKTLLSFGSIRIIANVRDFSKARSLFSNYPNTIKYDVCDIKDIRTVDKGIDYIIHCAANTSSKSFVESPLSVIEDNLIGTRRILELARANNVKKVVYLSTMEIYGAPTSDMKITESAASNLDILSPRSSYPESKRMCETLFASYNAQYSIPFCIARLTQTIGPGINYSDNRVFAEFARCIVEDRDIVLKTKGLTKRSYVYLADAVSAILTILLRGTSGEAYNVAAEDTYCSIYEMAQMVIDAFGNSLKVVINESDAASRGFAPELKMNLSADKLIELGWQPTKDLIGMYEALIEYLREQT